MKSPIVFLLAAGLLLGLFACGSKPSEHSASDSHGHEEGGEHGDHHGHGAEAAGARYAEGKGISLLEETKKAIGLELAEAEERRLVPVLPIEAQVYRAANELTRPDGEQTGSAYAAALINPQLAEKVRIGESAALKTSQASYQARIWRIDPVSKDAVNSVEAILEIADPQSALRVGQFVSGFVTEAGAEDPVLTVPRSAVLETATGSFAFVQNGDHLLRTPVKTGAENAEHIEITDGIYAGDVVATHPVETLYLIELRATKGGGHSH
ncbi:MAG TPA: hypothetical protein VFS35_04865 [Terrimicrobiaceae bacterium]|nr:hypothetical protein [Terrimicrobiaceae bacterium]